MTKKNDAIKEKIREDLRKKHFPTAQEIIDEVIEEEKKLKENLIKKMKQGKFKVEEEKIKNEHP